MTAPKMKPCPDCGNADVAMYGYGDGHFLNWHVECDDCHYLGPCGNKLQAVKLHNATPAPEQKIAERRGI